MIALNETASPINFSTVTLPAGVLLVHPGPSTDSIVNWTAPTTGTYSITGYFELLDVAPTGIIGEVFSGSTQLYRATLTGPPASHNPEAVGGMESFSLTETLSAGDALSFGVNNDGNYLNDSTGFDVRIGSLNPVPEPSSIVLLAMGILAVISLTRKTD